MDRASLIEQWLSLSTLAQPDNEFIHESLEIFRKTLRVRAVAWARGSRGKWAHVVAGSPVELPEQALAEASDQGASASDGWQFRALSRFPGEVVGVCQTAELADSAQASIDSWGQVLEIARGQRTLTRRTDRLAAILAIAAQWQQARDMDSLLTTMAEASTRLLNSERASIFLWDREQKLLVGRPALGVEGGELRIPDDRGIVGQVVQSGEPARVDRDESPVDRLTAASTSSCSSRPKLCSVCRCETTRASCSAPSR